MAADVLGAALSVVAAHHLANEGGLGLQCLPHIGVEAVFGDVAVNGDFGILITQTEYPSNRPSRCSTSAGFHGHRDGAGQPVDTARSAGTHFLRAADQHAHRPLPYFLEVGLFLGVGFGVADTGDLLARDAVGDELFDDVILDSGKSGAVASSMQVN